MRDTENLNERAAGLLPLWHMDAGKAFFAGPLDHNRSHVHSVAVLVAGLESRFSLRIGCEPWQLCRLAVIPAGTPYEFDVGGNPIAVLYLEPAIAAATALLPLVRDRYEVHGAVLGASGDLSLIRALWEDRRSATWAGEALNDLLDFCQARAPLTIDHRIAAVVHHLYAHYEDERAVGRLAMITGLSSSRFQHLFTKEVGVPFRRFRSWCRMRAAIKSILQGHNFTRAAHAAGFADQAHFCRDFRRTFGAPASPGLAKVRQPD